VLQAVHAGHNSLADDTHVVGRDIVHARRHVLSPRHLRDDLRIFSTIVDTA